MHGQSLDGLLGRVGLGHDGRRETQLGRLPQAFLSARCRAHFAGQADFAEGDEAARQGAPAQAALDGQHDGQVRGRLADAHAADGVDEDILVEGGDSRVPVQHCQHHGEAVALDAHGQAARAGPAGIDQRLDLDQQRTSALQRDEHARSRHGIAVGR